MKERWRRSEKEMLTIDKNDIEGITMLSVEEARKLPQWILADGNRWWLRSSGRDRYDAAGICGDGSILSLGRPIRDAGAYVRPAIKINVRPYLPLMIGETVLILGRLAQFVGNDAVLLCESIGCHRFDEKCNDYEKSEIKVYLEGWLDEELKK